MFLTPVPAQQLLMVRGQDISPKGPTPPWQDKDPQSNNFHLNVLKPILFFVSQ